MRLELWLHRLRAEVFGFFSEARNLESITPSFLQFVVLTTAPIVMKAGTLIDYRLRLHGFRMKWRTLISCWEPPHRFVDEQLRGPYRQWIHEHTFEERNGGTLAVHEMRFAVPGGAIVDRLLVRRDVEAIFAFREKRLREIFSTPAIAIRPARQVSDGA